MDTEGVELKPGTLLMHAWVAEIRHSARCAVPLALLFAARSYAQTSLLVAPSQLKGARGG
jgi:hypothetical protein